MVPINLAIFVSYRVLTPILQKLEAAQKGKLKHSIVKRYLKPFCPIDGLFKTAEVELCVWQIAQELHHIYRPSRRWLERRLRTILAATSY